MHANPHFLDSSSQIQAAGIFYYLKKIKLNIMKIKENENTASQYSKDTI